MVFGAAPVLVRRQFLWILHYLPFRNRRRFSSIIKSRRCKDGSKYVYSHKGSCFLRLHPKLVLHLPRNHPLFRTVNFSYLRSLSPDCSGILLRDIADYQRGKHKITWVEISFDVVGIVVAVGIVIAGAVYGRRVLSEAEGSSDELDGHPIGEALPNVVGSPVHRTASRGFQPPALESEDESEGHRFLQNDGQRADTLDDRGSPAASHSIDSS